MGMYDELLPDEKILMPRQASPLNGDTYACNEFIKLRDKFNIKKILELGSCVFGSTKWFAQNFQEVITVEICEEFRNIGLKRTEGLTNITSILGDSINALPLMLNTCDDKTIIFIDSHWQTLPLFDELKLIKQSGLKPCIVVHDCLIPNEPKLGYDSYEGVDISYETMKPYIDDIYGADNYEYHYNTDAESTDVKRGIIYIYPKIKDTNSKKKTDVIVNHFSGRGSDVNVLEIGTNDSNSLNLISMGCNAYLIEPSPIMFAKTNKLYKDNDKVKCFPFAISTNNGIIDFKEIDGVSDNNETINSNPENVKYNIIKVIGMDLYTFTVTSNQNKFNFISIDCNVFDFDVLKQIDLNNVGCEMLLVKFNGN